MSKLNILYEDNHIIVVVKPENILSQKDSTQDNSIMDDKKYNFIKKPIVIYEKKNKSNLNTKRKKSNIYN